MQEIKLLELFKYYATTWPLSVAIVVGCLLVGVTYNVTQTPLYKSSAKIAVSGRTGSSASRETELGNLVELIKSQHVLDVTAKDLGTDAKAMSEIRQTLSVVNTKNTEIISLELATASPDTSYAFVQGIISSFQESIGRIYDSPDNTIRLTIIDQPAISTSSYNYQPMNSYAIALASGLAISFIIAFVRFDIKSATKSPAHGSIQLEHAQTAARVAAARAEKLAYDTQAFKIKAERDAHKAAFRIQQKSSVRVAKIRAARDLEVARRDARIYVDTSRKVVDAISNHKLNEATRPVLHISTPPQTTQQSIPSGTNKTQLSAQTLISRF